MGRLQRSQLSAPQRDGHVPPCEVRGQLRRLGGRHPSTRRVAAGRSGRGASPDGPTPVRGEDDDRPHRRRFRLLGLPHPASTPTRLEQAVRLHLAVEEGARLRQGQGADDHPRRNEPTARSRAAPVEPGAPRLGQLLPARRVQSDLRLPECLQLAAGDLLASPQASPGQLEVASTSLPSGIVGPRRRRGHPVQPDVDKRSPAIATGERRIPTPWTRAEATVA